MNSPNPTTTPRPADIFLNLIITFLAPMFLATTDGDILQARAAAAATVNAYTARNEANLLPIALIIALSLAILDSLNRSMDDTISLGRVLRLRGNAVSLGRLIEQCRRALPADGIPDRPTPAIDPAAGPALQDEAPAAVPQAERRLARVQSAPNTPQPQPVPAPTTTTPPTQSDRHNAAWAAAMTDVAREFATGLDDLPPHQRKAATTRAAVLSSVAQQLLSGGPLPPPRSYETTTPSHQRHHRI